VSNLFSLQECFRHFVEARPPLWGGGLVFEVAFGGVSDSLGTNRLGGARAKPVTYRRDRRKRPLDAAQGHDSAGVNARLERCVGPDLTEEKNRLMRNEATIRPE
jgi:hypothetical protein